MTYTEEQILGSYLAGLWEGDGHITIAKRGGKPAFHISFNIKDSPVAKKLLNYIQHKCNSNAGSIRYQTKKNACVLNIYSIEGLKYLINLVNGRLRTPKAHQIDLIIDWLNSTHNVNIQRLPISNTALWEDAWLAGFIDADGSFGIELLGQCKQVVCKFRLAQRMHQHLRIYTHTERNPSYRPIMSSIADYLFVKLNVRKQIRSGRSYYIVSMSSARSKKNLRAYLDKYPLLTSKFLDYKDWCAVDDLILMKKHYTEQGQQDIAKFKSSMNNSRVAYNWGHLDLF